MGTRQAGNGGTFDSSGDVPALDSPRSPYSFDLAQIGGATLACGPVLAAVAIAVGRFTPVVALDLLGCCVLAAALYIAHRFSLRPAPVATGGSALRSLRNLTCLGGFAAIGVAVAVSYNVQVAGPNASAGTIADPREGAAAVQPAQPQGDTNITIHCENGKVDIGSRRSR